MMTVSAMELTPNESLAVFAAETIALLHQLVEQYPYRLVALPDLSHRRPRPGPRRFDGSELDRLHTLLRAAQAIAVGLRKLRTRRLAVKNFALHAGASRKQIRPRVQHPVQARSL